MRIQGRESSMPAGSQVAHTVAGDACHSCRLGSPAKQCSSNPSLSCPAPAPTHLRSRVAVGRRHGCRPRIGAATLPVVLPLLLRTATPAAPAAVASASGQRALRFGAGLQGWVAECQIIAVAS